MSWTSVSLDSVAVLDRDSVHPKDAAAETPYVGLEHVDGDGRINTGETIFTAELKSNKFRFSGEHVLFGKLRPYLRKIARPDFSGVCSTDIIPLLPSDQLDRDYLYHYLRTPAMVEFATSRCSGANLPRLSPKQLASFQIPLPPLAEQKRIAGILDAADALRAKRRETIEQLDTLIQSVFLEMFGDPVTNPKEWETSRLEDTTNKITDGTHKTPKYVEEGVEFLSAKDLKNGEVQWDTGKFISESEHAQLIKRCNPGLGDILLAKSGSLGSTAVIDMDREFSLFESLCLIKPNADKLLALFLSCMIQNPTMQSHLLGKNKGVAIKHLHLVDVRGLKVIVPPLNAQEKFVDLVHSVKRVKHHQSKYLTELDTLFASLQSHAFQGGL